MSVLDDARAVEYACTLHIPALSHIVFSALRQEDQECDGGVSLRRSLCELQSIVSEASKEQGIE